MSGKVKDGRPTTKHGLGQQNKARFYAQALGGLMIGLLTGSSIAGAAELEAARTTPSVCADVSACVAQFIDFGPKPKSKRFLLVEYASANPQVMALRLPSHLIGVVGAEPVVTFGILFFVWPDLTTVNDSLNRSFGPQCLGYCGGRMLAQINYNVRPPPLPDRSLNGFLTFPRSPEETVEPRDAPSGFTYVLDDVIPSRPFADSTIYVRTAGPGRPANVAICTDKTPVLGCHGSLASARFPGLELYVTFMRADINRWLDVSARLMNLVDSNVVAKLH